jgi:hypothetical protein
MTGARRSWRSLIALLAGAALASLAFAAVGQGGPTAARGFTACKDSRGYLYVPSRACTGGSEVVWNGEIPAVALGAKSLTKDAIVTTAGSGGFGETVKDIGGWKRTKRYVAKCPLDYVAVGGAFEVDWSYVYGVDIVSSRPRVYQGASAWQVLAVTEGPTNSAPQAEISVQAVCIQRTAIFPSG